MREAMGEEWFAKAKFHELEAQLSALQSDNDTLRAALAHGRTIVEALLPYADAECKRLRASPSSHQEFIREDADMLADARAFATTGERG
jgi:hypothetical protein